MSAYHIAHRAVIHHAERQAPRPMPQQPEPANFCASNDDADVPPPLTRRQLAAVVVLWCTAMAGSCWLAGWI